MSLTHLNKLLVNLKVIGRIEENGRISTTGRNQVSIEADSAFQALWRKLWGDSRERGVEAISSVVGAVIEISTQLLDSAYLSEDPAALDDDVPEEYRRATRDKIVVALGNVSKDMHAAVRGISNLLRTYAADAVMTAKLEQIIGEVENHVQKVDQRLIKLRENSSRGDAAEWPKPRLHSTRKSEY